MLLKVIFSSTGLLDAFMGKLQKFGEQGNQFAQYSLGRLYLDGREDFSPDTRQAERLSLIHI